MIKMPIFELQGGGRVKVHEIQIFFLILRYTKIYTQYINCHQYIGGRVEDVTRNLKEYAGIHYLIIACGINNIPHEPAANILKKMDQLGQQIGNVPHVFASIPYSPRYSQHFSKIQTVNQWVSEYNLLHSQTCLLLDEPSLTFLSDRLHLDRKSKVEVAGKLSCILDSFFATST